MPLDEINHRRFGPNFDRKCNDPRVQECARFQCQRADRCCWTPPAENQEAENGNGQQ